MKANECYDPLCEKHKQQPPSAGYWTAEMLDEMMGFKIELGQIPSVEDYLKGLRRIADAHNAVMQEKDERIQIEYDARQEAHEATKYWEGRAMTAEQQLASAKADTERLDWLARCCQVQWNKHYLNKWYGYGLGHKDTPDLREAIDAARKEGK